MMKNIVYIVCFLLFFSCANDKTSNQMLTKEEAVESENFKVEKVGLLDDADEKNNFDFSSDDVNSEIVEKIQANYEALVLAAKHPEFKEAIKEQLSDSNKFNVTLSDSIQTVEITALKLSGNLEKITDSIFQQKILYTTLINSKHTKKDSALVVMKRSMIVIDNSLKMNTSFSFEKLN